MADGITHYGGQIEFVNGIPGAPVPLPVFGAGAYRSPLLEPGCSCFQHAWVIAEPRFWQLGDPPLHMNVIRGPHRLRNVICLLEMGERRSSASRTCGYVTSRYRSCTGWHA